MRRVYRVYIALAICLLIAAGLAGFPWEGRLRPELGSTSEQELQKVKLLLPWSMQAQFAGPVVAAKPKGAYERERLLVEIEPGGFAVNTPMEVAQGNAEFGIVQPDQLILAQTQLTGSNRLRAIAIIFKESMTCFMVRTTSGIKTVSDFRGRRVGTKETTNVDVEFRAMLQKAGVRSAEMELIPVQYDIGLFISGRIDIFPGFVINEPYIARKAGIETELLKPSQFGVSLYGDVLVTSEKMLRDKRDIVQRFVDGTLQGWMEAKARPGEAVRNVLERSPLLDSDAQTFMAEAAIGLLDVGEQAFKSDPARWRENIGILEQFRGVKQGTVDADGLFTNEFVEHSNIGVPSE